MITPLKVKSKIQSDDAYDHDAADADAAAADDDDKLLGFVSEAAAYLPMVQHTVVHKIPS